ncbi:hypothetical protein SLS53_005583 [Cytospora paraplurivora]|uniref:NTF2 domain-containing protein n=1 Tax=Cytospora paraplurivora TaxID=2898453 RepID=A0AAN9U7H5_9PEZI
MALQAVYKQFLASPNSNVLAQNASLHYITTTTSYNGPTDIVKHFSSQRNHLRTKKESVLNVVEGQNTLAVQTELALEFLDHGGAYLPGLDDQFLSDRVVHIAVFHVVKFNDDGKITTIQQSWDQGALLKQLDVIGKTGRNWPIRDSQEQIKLITRAAGKPAEPTTSGATNRFRTNTGDAARSEGPGPTPVSPKAGARPRQRTFEEVLGEETDFDSPENQGSPSRVTAPKSGAGNKTFPPSRLFDKPDDAPEDLDISDDGRSPERYVKPHPKKYNHFDFIDGSDPADAPKAGVPLDAVESKHRQTWDFEDFATPQKNKLGKKIRQQNDRHWGTDENEIDSPAKPGPGKAAPGAARRAADSHFEMDDGKSPTGSRVPVRPRGSGNNGGLSLYNNHMVTQDGSEPIQSPDPRTLGNITNVKHRTQNYGPHFTMADNSPKYEDKPHAPVAEDRKKAVSNMQAQWSTYDESPVAQKQLRGPIHLKENGPDHRIKLGGDGMGNPKGGRGWSLGDESDEEQAPSAVPGRKGASQRSANSFWNH